MLKKLDEHLYALKRYFVYKRRDLAAFEYLPHAKLISGSQTPDIVELSNVGLVGEEHDSLPASIRLREAGIHPARAIRTNRNGSRVSASGALLSMAPRN